jgi:hypothetical protein
MSKKPLGPCLHGDTHRQASFHYSSTPIIKNVLRATDIPIDKETLFKAMHSIYF